ncbi:hypothetical protein B0T14DRAFT_493879 [Immersiella caudata]|uniref:Bacteriophage T5 Orf172 DNA-binding domain-containing protein n=1 Tax=Immersiella caudata TaxID=314043 RepID=A0AA39X6S9_9PEZI|nr:hypothetical protein B0T14DRAFT_493879 [Immersiella caudata]
MAGLQLSGSPTSEADAVVSQASLAVASNETIAHRKIRPLPRRRQPFLEQLSPPSSSPGLPPTTQLETSLFPPTPDPTPPAKTSELLFQARPTEPLLHDSLPVEIRVSQDESQLAPDPAAELVTPSSTPSKRAGRNARRKSAAAPKKSRAKQTYPVQPPNTDITPQKRSPKTTTEPKRAEAIDQDIEARIKAPTRPKNPPQSGFVYVIPTSIDGNNIIKIGMSGRAQVYERVKELPQKCHKIKLVDQLLNSRDQVKVKIYYQQVEQLAHKELGNFQYKFQCCGTNHREYYTVDYEVGRKVVDRWARFCRLEPYTEDWKLKEEWKFHLEEFSLDLHGRSPGGQEELDNHDERGRRWEVFLESHQGKLLWRRCKSLREKTMERGSWERVVVYFVAYWFTWSLILVFSAWLQRVPFVFLTCVMDRGEVAQLSLDWLTLLKDLISYYCGKWRVLMDQLSALVGCDWEKEGKIAGAYLTDTEEHEQEQARQGIEGGNCSIEEEDDGEERLEEQDEGGRARESEWEEAQDGDDDEYQDGNYAEDEEGRREPHETSGDTQTRPLTRSRASL